MSSTISTSRPSIEASRSLRIRTTPEDFVADPYDATAMKSTSHRDFEVAHQVRQEEHRTLEDPDQDQVLAGVVARDLGRELTDPAREVLGRDQDLPDRVVVGHRQVSLLRGALRAPCVARAIPRHRRGPPEPHHSAIGHGPDAVREIERGSPVVRKRRDLLGPPGRPRSRPAGGAVGQPLHDERAERLRELAQARQRDLSAAVEHPVDRRLEHRRLVAQDRRQRQHVLLGGRMDLSQRRHQPRTDPPAGVCVLLVALVLAPRAALAAVQYSAVCSRVNRAAAGPARPSRGRIPSSARRLGDDASR